MTLWRRVGLVLLWAVVALVVLRLVATATVAAAARAITVAHCVCRADVNEVSVMEWVDAVVVGVVRRALEGDLRVSGGCLFSNRAVNNGAGAIAKSRGSRASATRDAASEGASVRLAGATRAEASVRIFEYGYTFTALILYDRTTSYMHSNECFNP